MKKKFVCKEILIFIAYVLACVIDTSIRYTHFFLINMKHPDPELFKEPNFSQIIMDITYLVPVLIMSIIFIALLKLMHRYQYAEFRMNLRTMIYFFILEVILSILNVLGNVFEGESNSMLVLSRSLLNMLGIYPIQQAFCIIFLKKTRDPLDGLSKFDFLNLVSIT